MDYIGIFQGGGIKGLSYIGALLALEENGFKCKKAAGTSIGAIIAGMVSSGYNGKDLLYLIKNINFLSYLPKDEKKMKNIIFDKGLYSTNYIENEIRYLLSLKGIRVFKDLKIDNDYKLKVIATDIKKYQPIILPKDLANYQINPDYFPVSKAITMSATYPGFFKPHKIGNKKIIDGGLTNNYPIDVFNINNELVIGFKTQNSNNKVIKNQLYEIIIDTTGYKTLDFSINKDQRIELVRRGYIEGIKVVNKIKKDILKKIKPQ